MQPDDEIIIPQDDLYVITWESNFGKFPDSTKEVITPASLDTAHTPNGLPDDSGPSDDVLTGVDLRSTGPHQDGGNEILEETHVEDTPDRIHDQQSSGGSDTIVPEVLHDENDNTIVDNDSPRGGKYNLRPNPTPNFTDEYRY